MLLYAVPPHPSLSPSRGRGKGEGWIGEMYGQELGGNGGALQAKSSCSHRGFGQSGKTGITCDEESDRGQISGEDLPDQSRKK